MILPIKTTEAANGMRLRTRAAEVQAMAPDLVREPNSAQKGAGQWAAPIRRLTVVVLACAALFFLCSARGNAQAFGATPGNLGGPDGPLTSFYPNGVGGKCRAR
jgi:hypothetical protein